MGTGVKVRVRKKILKLSAESVRVQVKFENMVRIRNNIRIDIET